MASTNASLVDEWLEDDKLMLLEAWARDGLTYVDIADKIGVSPSTINTWRKKYPEIEEALRKGREIVDYKVENALLKCALGYTTKEIKVTLGKQVKNGQVFQITKETTLKEVSPNVTAIAMWLNNRRPDKWKRNRDKTIELDEDSELNITVVRGPKTVDDQDNINQSIQVSKKQPEDIPSKNTTKEGSVNDKDYWPDDWEDEDE